MPEETPQILPARFDQILASAISSFWGSRGSGSGLQGGSRGNVIGGKNLDGFVELVHEIADHCGLPRASVHSGKGASVTLPGYFRPTKSWDVLIIYKRRLLAVIELKSHVGSFGNNFNNRTEEALGNAVDIQHSALIGNLIERVDNERNYQDVRAPFVGYLMILEDCEDTNRTVRVMPAQFEPMAIFEGTSYADRYRILCERMMKEGLYNVAALALSASGRSGEKGEFRSLSQSTSLKHLFSKLAGHLIAELTTTADD